MAKLDKVYLASEADGMSKTLRAVKKAGKKGVMTTRLAAVVKAPVSTIDNYLRFASARGVVVKVQGPPNGVGRPPMFWVLGPGVKLLEGKSPNGKVISSGQHAEPAKRKAKGKTKAKRKPAPKAKRKAKPAPKAKRKAKPAAPSAPVTAEAATA